MTKKTDVAEKTVSKRLLAERGYQGVMPMWIIVLIVTLLRLVYVYYNQRPLGIEEAQYWSWSTHLAWGYHSKGPMIAWLIHLSTGLNGSGLFGVRFFAPLTYAISTFMVYFAAYRLFDRKIAFYGAMMFLFLPAVSFSSTVISTDPIMIMFWAIALYNFIEARAAGSLRHWVLCGIAIGLGMLAKYTMGVFVLSVLFFIILHEREHLKSKGLYIAFILAFLILLPNLIWNSSHHWVTFSHVSKHNADLSSVGFHLNHLGDFIGSQFGVAGPVVFLMFLLLFVWVAFLLVARKDCRALDAHNGSRSDIALLFWQIAPLFVAICIEAILARAYANWAAPIYIAACIFICALWLKYFKSWLLMTAIVINLLLGLVFYAYELSYQYGIQSVTQLVKVDPFKRNRPWPALGHTILNIRLHNWNANFLFDSRTVLSESLYYGQIPLKQAFVYNPSKAPSLQYDLPTTLSKGQNFVYITQDKGGKNALLSRFAKATLTNVVSMSGAHYQYEFYIYALKGFKGYLVNAQ